MIIWQRGGDGGNGEKTLMPFSKGNKILKGHLKGKNGSPFYREKWTTEKKSGAKMEPFWKTVPLLRVEPFFSLIIMFRKKMAPPSEVTPLKVAPK